MITRFFSYVYLVYCILLFAISFLVAVIPIWFNEIVYPEPKRIRRNHPIFKVWMDIYLFLIACSPRVSGKDIFTGEACVIIANHSNFMDITLTSPYIPIANKTLAKKELDKYPIFNILYRSGSILIDRKSATSRQESFEQMRYFLANKVGVCLFPEGTRNRTEQPLLSFKDGAFRLAREENVPVIITALLGTKNVLNMEGQAKPTRLGIHFIERVDPSDFGSAAEMSTYCHKVLKYFLNKQKSS